MTVASGNADFAGMLEKASLCQLTQLSIQENRLRQSLLAALNYIPHGRRIAIAQGSTILIPRPIVNDERPQILILVNEGNPLARVHGQTW
jgi:hypothetical protein